MGIMNANDREKAIRAAYLAGAKAGILCAHGGGPKPDADAYIAKQRERPVIAILTLKDR